MPTTTATTTIAGYLLPLVPDSLPDFSFLGNSSEQVYLALIAFLVFLLVFMFLQAVLLSRFARLADRTKTDLDDRFLQIVRTVKPPFYSFVALYLALQFLNLSPLVSRVLAIILLVWALYTAIKAVQILIDYAVEKHIERDTGQEAESAVRVLSGIAKWILWGVGLLLVLSNLGVEITSLVAGLGVGGIAIAFALQNILADLFSSFAIYFDKPFVEGDFIRVGESLGEVKKVGIKTTRLKSLTGEEIVLSNQELTSTKIQNYGRMAERRIQFSLGVLYETPQDKIRRIPDMLKDAVEGQEKIRFDRAHLKEFGDSAFVYEVVYFVLSGDYNEYMDIQQAINFSIVDTFEKNQIEFAYPTRTIHLQK